jgi:serine/threonine protein kinase
MSHRGKQSLKKALTTRSGSGSRLSDFQVLGKLGSGSFGTVFKVLRKTDSKVYVLKKIPIADMEPKEQKDAINEVCENEMYMSWANLALVIMFF